MLSRYDIVLVAFPFTDGPAAKPRPALVIVTSDRHGDVLLAFISSNISGPTASDELDIPAEHPGFSGTGLKVSSRLRLSRMTTLAMQMTCQQVLQRVIGGQA